MDSQLPHFALSLAGLTTAKVCERLIDGFTRQHDLQFHLPEVEFCFLPAINGVNISFVAKGKWVTQLTNNVVGMCWRLGLILIALQSLIVNNLTAIGADHVTVEPLSNAIVVRIHGAEFTVLHHGDLFPKPYFWPVRASDRAILTRPIDPNEKDHPHHRGIWVGVDEVNQIKFWGEHGKIATREITSKSGDPATIELKNEWVGPDELLVLMDRTKISIFPNRMIAYDIKLTVPKGHRAQFDDTKEGFFAIRIAQSMRESEGGVVVNSEGLKTTQGCWGLPAKWVDYSGKVGSNHYGVTVMDHPENFRPSRFHVRDYGLFAVSPFGEGAYQNDPGQSKPVVLDDATPSLRLRYGIYVHDGNASEENLTKAYAQFVKLD